MAYIYNSELTKNIIDGAKIAISREQIPNQLAEKVVPVMEVNPRLIRTADVCKSATLNNATTATILTTPTDMDFYLCSASISFIKDVTSTATTLNITFTDQYGVSQTALRAVCFTLTVQNGQNSISFPFPIKCARNTIIAITSDTNVANIRASASISGYTDYVSKQ
jgi:hypothetical protein